MTARARQGAAVVAGVATAAGIAYALQRGAVARLRRRAPESPFTRLELSVDRSSVVTTDDGAALHVYECGPVNGRPLVLLHGWTINARTFMPQFELLPTQLGTGPPWRVIAVDQRGHGRSTRGTDVFTIDRLASDLALVLDELALEDAIIVGHSMGGMALMQLCAHRSPTISIDRRVAGIVLMSTSARPLSIAGSPVGEVVARSARLSPKVSSALMSRRYLGYWITSVGIGRDLSPMLVEQTREMILNCDAQIVVDGARAILRFNALDDLHAIELPTLVVCGTHDRLTPLGESRRMVEGIAGAELDIIEGSGHMVMLEHPAALHAALARFVERCDRERNAATRPSERG